jgi:predicted lipid-binding transport protein (Tim44 family)
MTPSGEASVTVVSDDLDPLDRLESAEQIRQLVARFAMAYDARDLVAIAGLYAPDVRDGLMATLIERMPAGRTFHLTASPVVTFEGADAARGDVVGRSEAEVGEKWMVMGVRYADRYVRIAGTWFLESRDLSRLYASDVLARP